MSNNKRGGYETSFGGLIGAMIVMVACVLGFVGFRELTREVPETKQEAIDWKPVAEAAMAEGHPIAVPEVPQDWIVTNIRFEPTLKPTWDLAMHTAKGKFVGLYQTDERVEVLVETRIDEDAEEGEEIRIATGDLAGEWMSFTDDGGDFALVREDENGVVLVYGSAPREQIIDLAGTITVGAPQDAAQQ